MLPTGLVCLICFFFSGVAGGGWFHLEIVECNGSRPRPQDGPSCKPLLGRWPWLSMLLVAVMPVTLNVSPGTLVSWGFLRLLPRPFHQTLPLFTSKWLPRCMSHGGVCGPPSIPVLHCLLPVPTHGHLEPGLLLWLLFPLLCLPGPARALVHLGGTAAALWRVSMCKHCVVQNCSAAFVHSHSLQYVDLLTALGGLEAALCSL